MRYCYSFLIAFFVFSAFAANAQVSGYLGKRFAVDVFGGSFLAYNGPTPSNKGRRFYGEEGGGYGFNTRYGANLSYVVSRKRSLFLGLEFSKTGMSQMAFTPSIGNSPGFQAFDEHRLFYHLDVRTLRFGYRKFAFKKGGLAPFGPYSGFLVNLSQVKGNIVDKKTSFITESTVHLPLGIVAEDFYWSLLFEFGYNNIIRDRFMFHISCQFDPTFGLLGYVRKENQAALTPDYTSDYVGFNQGEFEELVIQRLSNHNLLMINIGFGVLLF
ncbi:MAG: hypothetical protein GYB31_00720 [Bacteroidetes bacterium]|nr:hypothetical protein [Bacteroidota bacterium]